MNTDETKKTITWHCYCGTENQAESAGINQCKKCEKWYGVSPDGDLLIDGKIVRRAGQHTNGRNSNAPEQTLSTIATITLGIGIIASIILFFVGISEEPLLLLGIPIFMLPILMYWAFVKVFVNISMSLKEINQKTKSE